jgi:hypothetical protein
VAVDHFPLVVRKRGQGRAHLPDILAALDPSTGCRAIPCNSVDYGCHRAVVAGRSCPRTSLGSTPFATATFGGVFHQIVGDCLQPSPKCALVSRLERPDRPRHSHKSLVQNIIRTDHSLQISRNTTANMSFQAIVVC